MRICDFKMAVSLRTSRFICSPKQSIESPVHRPQDWKSAKQTPNSARAFRPLLHRLLIEKATSFAQLSDSIIKISKLKKARTQTYCSIGKLLKLLLKQLNYYT